MKLFPKSIFSSQNKKPFDDILDTKNSKLIEFTRRGIYVWSDIRGSFPNDPDLGKRCAPCNSDVLWPVKFIQIVRGLQ